MAAVLSLETQTFLGHNQATYQDLRLALQLNLRRQLLLAVCDDTALQAQLTYWLETDLNSGQAKRWNSHSYQPERVPLSPMVTLRLNADNPDPVRQVLLWLKQHRLLKASAQTIPAFQIVGLEQLTRRSSTLQNTFLSSLTYVDALITRLDCRLLIWVPRPWLGKIQQSAPGFWRSRSGLFEFVGDPTPTADKPISFEITSRQAQRPAETRPAGWEIELPDLDRSAHPYPADEELSPPQAPGSNQPQNLWTVLREDLAAFEHPSSDIGQNPPTGATQQWSAGLSDRESGTVHAYQTSPPAEPTGQSQQHRESASDLFASHFTVVDDAPLDSVILRPGEETPTTSPAAATQTNLSAPAHVDEEIDADVLLPTPQRDQFQKQQNSLPSPGQSSLIQPSVSLLLKLPDELASDPDVVALWDYICTLEAQQAGPMTLSRAYLGLGQKSRDRIEAGLVTQPLLDFAIDAYRKAVQGLLEGEENWCDALNDLASLYWIRSQQEEAANTAVDWLQLSVEAYQHALNGSHPGANPETCLRLYSNLGTVYSLLAGLDAPLENLQNSQTAYEKALPYAPVEALPVEFANLQNSLGAIHWRLAQLENSQHHLHLAIHAYSEALRYRTPQATPLDYAMIQNNLGIAYWNLSQHESALPLLEKAVAAYQTALKYRTVDVLPHGCAATHNNLGTAYWDLAQLNTRDPDQRLVYLQQAVAAYENALNAAELALRQDANQALGFDVWATFHSAGVVHDQLAQGLPTRQTDQRKLHLQKALEHYLLAYQGWQDNPQQLETLIAALVYNVHLNFEILGLPGQQAVLSQVPGELLPEILRQL